jgi:hypothetical protein
MGAKVGMAASTVCAALILLGVGACRHSTLGPLDTAKEFERLYKQRDLSRKNLLTRRLLADKPQIGGWAADFGGSNPGGLAWVDAVFFSATENAGRGQGMGFGGEKITGDEAEVTYSLQGDPEADLAYTLTLVKEEGAWKIDGVGASASVHPASQR